MKRFVLALLIIGLLLTQAHSAVTSTFTEAGQRIGAAYMYDSGAGTYTSINVKGNGTQLFTDGFEAGDCLYFRMPPITYSGAGNWWYGIKINVVTAIAAESWTGVWEYMTSASAATTIGEMGDDTESFSKTGWFKCGWPTSSLSGWPDYISINSVTGSWIRFRITAVTNPTEGGAFGANDNKDYIWAMPSSTASHTGTGSFVDIVTNDRAASRTLMDTRTNAGDGADMFPSLQIQSPAGKYLELQIDLAGSSAGAGDTIDVYGYEWDGTAIGETIDVSSGDATYYTAGRYFRLQKVVPNGFSDGTITIYQNIFGAYDLIAPSPNQLRRVDIIMCRNCHTVIGNASTATTITHSSDVLFVDNEIPGMHDGYQYCGFQYSTGRYNYFYVSNNATLTLGSVGALGYGTAGGLIALCSPYGGWDFLDACTGGTVNMYGGVIWGGFYGTSISQYSGGTWNLTDGFVSTSTRLVGTNEPTIVRTPFQDSSIGLGNFASTEAKANGIRVYANTPSNINNQGSTTSNHYLKECDAYTLYSVYDVNSNFYARDCKFLLYTIGGQTDMYKRVTFDPMVVDYKGEPISGATIDVKTYTEGTINADIASPYTTDATGKIATAPAISLWHITGTNIHSASLNTNSTQSTKAGVKITATSDMLIHYVEKNSSCTATTAYVYADDLVTLLATGTFVSNSAILNYEATSGVSYYVLLDNGGSNYTARYNSVDTSFPQSTTYYNFVGGYTGSADSSTKVYNIARIQAGDYYYPFICTVRSAGKETMRTIVDDTQLQQKFQPVWRLRDAVSVGRDEQGDELR